MEDMDLDFRFSEAWRTIGAVEICSKCLKIKQLANKNINWMILATGVYLTQIISNNDAYEA
jgi:hypothetical protein